jgi:hypothetical protein
MIGEVAMRSGSLAGSVLAVLIVSLATSCSGGDTDNGAVPVSVVRLLTDPKEFSGKQIEVTGYLQKNPTLRLFLSKDHGAARDIQSSVIVSDDSTGGSLTQSGCLNQYVQVTGTFDLLMGAAWAIVNVEDVMHVETVETCWKRQ